MKDLEDIGKPMEPGPGDCCGSGCPRCVWDIYFDNLAEWEAKRAEAKSNGGLVVEPALPLPSSSSPSATCASFAGSVVLKYVEDDDATDDFGVMCSSESRNPVWSQGMVRVARVTSSSSSGSEACHRTDTTTNTIDATTLPLVTLDLSVPISDVERFSPGDVVEVLVPNDQDHVKALCRHFKVPMDRLCQFHVSPFVAPTCFPPWVPQRHNITVGALLTYYIDITSSAYLRKPFFALLQKAILHKGPVGGGNAAAAATAVSGGMPTPPPDVAKCPLDELLSDLKRLSREVQATMPSLHDILARFAPIAASNGAHIPLAKFLEVSAPLRARKFSVVDVADGGSRVVLCVRDVRHKRHRRSDDDNSGDRGTSVAGAEAPTLVDPALLDVVFRGHVAKALCVATPAAAAAAAAATTATDVPWSPQVSLPPPLVWVRSLFGRSMIPRPYVARPLLMLAGGSGISPILSLLVAARRAAMTATPSPVWQRWLFFGCRTPQDLHSVLGDGHGSLRTAVLSTCTRIDVSVSRLPRGAEDTIAKPMAPLGGTGAEGGNGIASSQAQAQILKHTGHVTTVLLDEAEAIREWVHGSKAAVVACGPTVFLTSIRETLTKVLYPEEAGDDASVGEQQFRMMELQGDVVFEDWTNRK